MMKKVLTLVMASAISTMTLAEVVNSNEIGGLESLRSIDLSIDAHAEPMKKTIEGESFQRDFVDMPPLVPHSVDNLQVDKDVNTCMKCHSIKNASKWGATKVAVSHFNNREGQQLADLSPSRYFCLTCHVPQKDAKPLKENTFEPVESLKQ